MIPIAVNAKNEAANLSIAVLRASGSRRPRNLRPDRRKLAGERGKPALGLNGEIFFVENGVDPTGFGGGPTIVDISERLGEEITFDIYVQAIGMLTPLRGLEADFPCVGQGGTGGSVAFVQDSGKIDQFLRSDFVFRFMPVSMGIDQSKCPDGNVRFAVALVGMDKDITGLGPLYVGNFTVAVSGDAAGSHTFPLIGGSLIADVDSQPIPAFLHELVLVASDGESDRPTIKHGDFETTNTQPCSGYIDPRFDSTNGVVANLGLVNDATDPTTVELTIEFSEPVFSVGGGEVGPGDFEVTETGGGSPPVVIRVVDVFDDDTVFTLGLSRSITVQEWTTVRAIVQNVIGVAIQNDGNLGPGALEPDRVDVGFFPGDINQTGYTSPVDYARGVQKLLGICTGNNCPECSGELAGYDIDRRNFFSPIDMIRWRQLFVGVGSSTRPWDGKSMNSTQP